jgi:hypothetical protein
MPHLSVADTMYRITAPDGTALWQGAALVGDILFIENTEASATITAGEAVRIDTATLRLGHFNMTAGATAPTVRIGGLRVSAVANTGWLGVSMEPIVAGKMGRVMGDGSICCVQSTGGPTVNTVGAWVTGSAVAGKVESLAAPASGAAGVFPAGGTVLGTIIQIAGTTGPPTDTGTANVIGIMLSKIG